VTQTLSKRAIRIQAAARGMGARHPLRGHGAMLKRLLRALAPRWRRTEAAEPYASSSEARACRRGRAAVRIFLLRHHIVLASSAARRQWLVVTKAVGASTFVLPLAGPAAAECRTAGAPGGGAALSGGCKFCALVRQAAVLRGIRLVSAATLVAEVGDLTRFDNPKQLMAYVGLVPSEHSSGAKTKRGRITRAGNAQARTMLIEAGWSYRLPAREERRYRERVIDLPEDIQAIGWKAQVRLCQRYRRLAATGKPQPKVTTAIARELVGYAWDIARRVSPAIAG
jgi:hypothetical protein